MSGRRHTSCSRACRSSSIVYRKGYSNTGNEAKRTPAKSNTLQSLAAYFYPLGHIARTPQRPSLGHFQASRRVLLLGGLPPQAVTLCMFNEI